MDHQIASEEKLLKLIRKKGHASGAQDAKQKDSPVPGEKKPKGQLDLLKLSRTALILLSVIFFGYIIAQNFFVKQPGVEEIVAQSTVAVEEVPVMDISKIEPKPFSYYGSAINKRDIFNPMAKRAEFRPVKVDVPPDVLDPTSELKLVGIVLDQEPEAIIEDLGTRQTLFLRKGDMVKGAVIEDIMESKVTFSFENRILELSQ